MTHPTPRTTLFPYTTLFRSTRIPATGVLTSPANQADKFISGGRIIEKLGRVHVCTPFIHCTRMPFSARKKNTYAFEADNIDRMFVSSSGTNNFLNGVLLIQS